jgi:quinol-cytochrome oxidoreductase complex cytochrome b subunit
VGDSSSYSPARDAGLFLVLAILFNGLVYPGPLGAELAGTFYLAFFVHAGFTLYDGRFSARRTKTWLALAALWACAQIWPFAGYITFLGQLDYWLFTVLVNLGLASLDPDHPGLLPLVSLVSGVVSGRWAGLLMFAALCVDFAVLYHERWRGNAVWRAAIFAGCACAGGLVLGLALGAVVPPPPPKIELNLVTPPHILPAWYQLPEYAMLRAIPTKLAGVAVMFCAVLLPLLGPWMRADALRTGRWGWLWALLCVLLGAAWIGLGYLGSRPVDSWPAYGGQVLVAYYFAFFLVLPPLLHRISRMP